MTSRLKISMVSFLIFIVLGSPMAQASSADPMMELWDQPLRLQQNQGVGMDWNQISLGTVDETIVLATHDGERLTLFTCTSVNGSFSATSGPVIEHDETSPQLVSSAHGLHLITFESRIFDSVMRVRTTQDGVHWVHSYETSLPPTLNMDDVAVAISDSWRIDAVWTDHSSSKDRLVHAMVDGFTTSISSFEPAPESPLVSHRSPALRWVDDTLYAAWISTGFDRYTYPGEHDEIQLVTSKFTTSWSPYAPILDAYTVDATPSFVQGSTDALLVFSSDRVYDPVFESERTAAANIWIANLEDEGHVGQLPAHSMDEHHPVGVGQNGELLVMWRDSNGWMRSAAQDQYSVDTLSELTTHLSVSPGRVEAVLSNEVKVTELSLHNNGQLPLRGQLIPSEGFVLEVDTFVLEPGDSITSWVEHQQVEPGIYNGHVTIEYGTDALTVPISVVREDGDSHASEFPPPMDDQSERRADHPTLVPFVFALLVAMGCATLALSRVHGLKSSVWLMLMVGIIVMMPLSKAVDVPAERDATVREYPLMRSMHVQNLNMALNEGIDPSWTTFKESIAIADDAYLVDGFRFDIHVQHAVKSLSIELDHGSSKDVFVQLRDKSTGSTQLLQVVHAEPHLNRPISEASTVHVNATGTLIDQRRGGSFDVTVFALRPTGLPSLMFDGLKTKSYAPSNATDDNLSVRYPKMKFFDHQDQSLVFNTTTQTLSSLSFSHMSRAVTDDDWQTTSPTGDVFQTGVSIELDVPVVQQVHLMGESGSTSDRFITNDEEISLNVSLKNEAYVINGERSLQGRVHIGVIDVTNNRYAGVLHCSEILDIDEVGMHYTHTFVVKDVNAVQSVGGCDMYPAARMYEDNTYAFVVDFLPEFETDIRASLSRWGADWHPTLVRDELASTMFVLTFGEVLVDASIVHQDRFQSADHSNTVYLLHARDAPGTLPIDENEVIRFLMNDSSFPESVILKHIRSTSEFQALMASGMQGGTVVNLHGDVLPLPQNYLLASNTNEHLLGDWQFNGEGVASSVKDETVYANTGVVHGDPVFVPDSPSTVSSLYFDGTAQHIALTGSSASVVPVGDRFMIDFDGSGVYNGSGALYDNATEATAHLPAGLFNLQDQQIHLSMKAKQIPDHTSSSLAAYSFDEASSTGWQLALDRLGHLQFKYGTGSSYETLETPQPIDADTWISVDVTMNRSHVALIIDGIEVSSASSFPIAYSRNSTLLLAGGLPDYADSSMNIDRFFIANEPVSHLGYAIPSQADIATANNWVEEIGRWISESNINFVSLTPDAMDKVGNTHSDWENKWLQLERGGLDQILRDFSIPAEATSSAKFGSIRWSDGLPTSASIGSLSGTKALPSSLASESILLSGDASVLERYHVGLGSVVVSSVDLSSPYFIEEVLVYLREAVNRARSDSPELIFLVRPDCPSDCSSWEALNETYNRYGKHRIVVLNDSGDIERLVTSGVRQSTVVLDPGANALPVSDTYLSGASPGFGTKALYTFEEERTFEIEVLNSLAENPGSTPVWLNISAGQNGVVESYVWDASIDPLDAGAMANLPGYWSPQPGSIGLTAAALANIINHRSEHFSAVAAATQIVLTTNSEQYLPDDLSVVASNADALHVLDQRRNAQPVDSSVHRIPSSTVNATWEGDAAFGSTAISLDNTAQFNVSGYLPEKGDFSIDFWMKINSFPETETTIMNWSIGGVENNHLALKVTHLGELNLTNQSDSVRLNSLTPGSWHAVTLSSSTFAVDKANVIAWFDGEETPVDLEMDFDWTTNEAVKLQFHGLQDGLVMDNLHLTTYRDIKTIRAADLDVEAYFDDWAFFVGQNQNVLISSIQQSLNHLSVESLPTFSDVSVIEPYGEPMCLLDGASQRLSFTRHVDCTHLPQTLPSDTSGAVPVCIAEAKGGAVVQHRYYLGADACGRPGVSTMLKVIYGMRVDWNNGSDDVSLPSTLLCFNATSSTINVGGDTCDVDHGFPLYVIEEGVNLSAFNRMFRNELPPLLTDVASSGQWSDEGLHPSLLENMASFGYDRTSENLTTFANDVSFLSQSTHVENKTLVSPTGNDWFYPVRSQATSDGGAWVGASVLPIHGGHLVIADHDAPITGVLLGEWAAHQPKVQMHVIGEHPGMDMVQAAVLEAEAFGYAHITEVLPSDGLLDAIDGVYRHEANGKLLMMGDYSTLVTPDEWFSDVSMDESMFISVTTDPFYDGPQSETMRIGVPLSNFSTDCASGPINITLTVSLNQPMDSYVFGQGLHENSDGSLTAGVVGYGQPCDSTAAQWNFANFETDVERQPIAVTGKTNQQAVSQSFELNTTIHNSWTHMYLEVTANKSHIPYKIQIEDIQSNNRSVMSEFIAQQSAFPVQSNNGVPTDYNVGFLEDLTRVEAGSEAFSPNEVVERFARFIARNGHHLVMPMNGVSLDLPFSSVTHYTPVGKSTHWLGEGGWKTFASGELDGLTLERLNSTQDVALSPSLKEEYIVQNYPAIQDPLVWGLDVHNEHVHELVTITGQNGVEHAVRALVTLGRGGLVFVGDDDLYAGMSFGLDYTFEERRIDQTLGIFTKGDTVTLEIDISTSGSLSDLHARYALIVKPHGAQGDDQKVADVLTKVTDADTTLETLYLSWRIDSSEHIGGYDLEIEAIDTVLNRVVSRWGDTSNEIISIEVVSLLYITDVLVPTVTGVFDDAVVEVEVINEMSVSNLVDLSLVFTHATTGAMYWTPDSTTRCAARKRCQLSVRWDAVSHQYDGQVREVGTYQGRAVIQDHASRYQVKSLGTDGSPVYEKKNAMLDAEDFLFDVSAELEIVLPLNGGDWFVRFSTTGPWALYEAGSIIRRTDVGQEFQLQKTNNATPGGFSNLSIRYATSGDAPNFLTYSVRTSDMQRDRFDLASVQNYLHHVNKFAKDGTQYIIETNGMERGSILSVVNEPSFELGSLSHSVSDGKFDRHNRTLKMDGLGERKSVSAVGYTAMFNVTVDGYYRFTWENMEDETPFLAVINSTYWTPNFNATDSKEFDADVDENDVLFFEPATGDVSNYYLGLGSYSVFVGASNIGDDDQEVPILEGNFSISNIRFSKGVKIDLPPTPACPTSGYDQEKGERLKSKARDSGKGCDGEGVNQREMGPIGLAAQGLPASVVDMLTSKIKLPLIGANAEGGGTSFSHEFGNLGLAKMEFGWTGDAFSSDLALSLSLEGEMTLEGTGIKIDYGMSTRALIQGSWFAKYCYVDLIVWECHTDGLSSIANYLGWYVEFDVELQIPIAQYLWGEPVDIRVRQDGNNYYTLVADAYIDVDLNLAMFNNVYICDNEETAERFSVIASDVACGSGGDVPSPQAVNLHMDLSIGVRLVFKFYMKFEFKQVAHKLQFIKRAADSINQKVEAAQTELIEKIQQYENQTTAWVEEKYNETSNKLTRSQLHAKFKAKTGAKYKSIQAAAAKFDKNFREQAHAQKVSGEAKRWLDALGPAVKIDSLIPNGYVKFDFAIGIYAHFDMECSDVGQDPCKMLISIELFMDVDATAHIVLFRICVWFLGCWTPTIDLDFSMKLDKVVFISAFGGPDGWGDADGSFGAVMFCDRSTGFPNYGPHRKDVSSMATNFKPGEGLSVHPHSEININLLGLVHLRFGIPNLNC